MFSLRTYSKDPALVGKRFARQRFADSRESIRANQKGLEVCYCLWGVPSRPSPGSSPGPVQVPSRVRGGPVQIRHVLCFTVFRTHPGPEVGAIPARPGPILLPSVPYRIGPGRAETDFLATSERILAGLETQTQNAAFFERKRPKRKPWHRGKFLSRKKGSQCVFWTLAFYHARP